MTMAISYGKNANLGNEQVEVEEDLQQDQNQQESEVEVANLSVENQGKPRGIVGRQPVHWSKDTLGVVGQVQATTVVGRLPNS
ncbi:hypothetical protein EJB05_52628, partial [Eragrostis curvula]